VRHVAFTALARTPDMNVGSVVATVPVEYARGRDVCL
jgi:hypothetical protein